jgi:hypothetical protein
LLHARYGANAIDHRSRLAGVGAAVLVHLLLIAFVLSGLPKLAPVPRSVREIILVLSPKVKRVPARPQQKALPRPRAIPPLARYRHTAPMTGSQTAPPLSEGLRIPLFRCAPENLGKLSPDEQAECRSLNPLPPDHTVVALRSHVRDPMRHAGELAARRTPARVDCVTAVTRAIDNKFQDHGLMVDLQCADAIFLHALGR